MISSMAARRCFPILTKRRKDDAARSYLKNAFGLPPFSAGLVPRFKSSKYESIPPVLTLKRIKSDGESRAVGKTRSRRACPA
jgi:hypothetical protein